MKGTIIFNGNIKLETDFIKAFGPQILDSHHTDPAVRESRKVLLITAAWQKREFYENHVKQALYQIGLQPKFAGGYDQHVQNLSIYHDFNAFKSSEAELYAFYHSKQQVIQRVKASYRAKNSGLIAVLRRQLDLLKKNYHHMTLHKVLSYDTQAGAQQLHTMNPWELLYHYSALDIQGTLAKIKENDAQMLKICREIDAYFFSTSRIMENPIYQQLRHNLQARILSSNSIFIFGGHVAVLYNRLNFFKLGDTFMEALNRGCNFYTVSAGSLCLCDYIIVFDDESCEWTGSDKMFDFELFDAGFGLVKKVQLFPHCKDYIHMRDPDTVTYLTARFSQSLCLGMDQESFLLMETYQAEKREYERFTSVGKDEGLYIFSPQGQVLVKKYGEELMLPGTRLYKKG